MCWLYWLFFKNWSVHHTHTHTHTQNTCMHIQLENLHLMLYLQSTGGNCQNRVMFLNKKVRAKHFVYYEQCSQHDKKVLKAILCFSADGGLISEDVPLVEFMYLVFTRMPGDNYQRQLESLLLHLCYIFWVLINSLVFWFILRGKHMNRVPTYILLHKQRGWDPRLTFDGIRNSVSNTTHAAHQNRSMD